MSVGKERDRAVEIARTDPESGLIQAGGIASPWYRSQAFAWIAWLSEDESLFHKALGQAKRASAKGEDHYQVVGSSAWWLSAMLSRGLNDEARSETKKVVWRSAKIEHPVSKLEALFLVVQAVFADGKARDATVPALLESFAQANSWRAGRRQAHVALMIAGDAPKRASEIVEAMPASAFKSRALRALSAGEYLAPRSFFW